MTTAKYDELVQKLTDAKVKLKDVNGEYRSTYDIMADIAAKWDTMSSMEQSAMATALAGTRQQAVFFSIIDQFKEASGAMDQMRSSSGELKEAYSTYMDSAQAKTNQFKATFQEFSTNFFSSKFIGDLIDGGTYLLEIINHMAKIGTLLPVIISSVATFKAFKMTELFSRLSGQINTISNQILNERVSVDALVISTSNLNAKQKEAIASATLRKAKGDEVAMAMAKERLEILGLTTETKGLAQATNEANASTQTAVIDEEQLAQAHGTVGTSASVMSAGEQQVAQITGTLGSSAQVAAASEEQLAQANNTVGASAQAASSGLNAMGQAMGFVQKYASVILSALSTVQIIMGYWDDIKEITEYVFNESFLSAILPEIHIVDHPEAQKRSIQEIESELKQLGETATNTAKSFKSLKDSSDEIIPRYAQLAQGVDAFGKNINLSEEQYSEYISLNNKLAEMFPSINMGMDTNGNAMLRLSGNAEELTKNLNDLVEAQRKVANQEIASKLPDVIKDINELNTQVDNAKTQYANLNNERWNKIFNIIKDKPEISKTNHFRTEEEAEALLERNNQLRKYAARMGVTSKQELKGDYGQGFYYEIKWNYEEYDPKKARQVYEDGLSKNQRIIEDTNERIKERWKAVNPMLTAWMETDWDYNELSEKMQDVAKAMVAGLDFNKLGLNTESGIKDYVSKYIIAPLKDSGADVQTAFNDIANWQSQLKSGGITPEEFISKTKSAFDNLRQSMDPQSVDAFVQGFKAAGFEGENYSQIVESIAEAWSKVNETSVATLTDLSDSLTNLKTKLDVISKAQADMFNGDVTADTIKAIKDAIGEDKSVSYLDFLYKEGEAIKFNIEKWKEYSQIEINSNKDSINDTISKLEDERKEIEGRIVTLEEAEIHDDNWQEQLEAENLKLQENTQAIEANQNKLSIYESLYEKATENLDEYNQALENFKNVSEKIGEVSDSLTTVADLQERVRNGFSLSIEEALKFADVYPEILNKATVSASGQINLNSGVVNTFIKGKEAEIKADVQARIDELENKKETLKAQKTLAEAELKIAEGVTTGESKLTADAALYKIDVLNALVKKLVEGGETEVKANNLAIEAINKNYQSASNTAGEAAWTIGYNMGVAAEDIADQMRLAMMNVENNFGVAGGNSVTKFVNNFKKNAPEFVVDLIPGNALEGKKSSSPYDNYSSDPLGKKTTSQTNSQSRYKKMKSTSGNKSNGSPDDKLKNLINTLKLNIQNYTSAIDQTDGQIAALQAILNTTLNKFSTSFKDAQKKANKNKSDKPKSDTKKPKEKPKDTDSKKKQNKEPKDTNSKKKQEKEPKDTKTEKDNWFIKEYNKRNHLINMEKQEVSDYLDWLQWAYKKAYKEQLITLDDYYKYTEEIFNKRRELFADHLNDIEHEISMRSEYDGEKKKIIELYKGLIKDVKSQIKKARAQGLKDDDDYIQQLQDKYWSYAKARKEIEEDIKSSAKDKVQELVDIRIKMLKQDIANQKEAINKELDALKKFYDDQKQMLQDANDKEKYLEEQKDKRKAVKDVQSKLNSLERDNSAWAQKKKLELAQELTEKQNELNDFEKEHALKTAQDKFDKLYEKQEKALNKRVSALEAQENNAKALYDKALKDVRNGSVELYTEMIQYNNKYGDGIRDTIKTAWEDAYKALSDYKDLYNKSFNNVNLENATGYVKSKDNWDNAVISDKGSVKNTKASTSTTKSTSTNKTSTKQKESYMEGKKWTTPTHKADELNFEILEGKKWKTKGYASGTKNASQGFHRVDEFGSETIFRSKNGNKYMMFSDGDMVLDANASSFLYQLATKGRGLFERLTTGVNNNIRNVTTKSSNPEIVMGDIIINGNADKATVSEIRRAQRESVEMILKEFKKLNK